MKRSPVEELARDDRFFPPVRGHFNTPASAPSAAGHFTRRRSSRPRAHAAGAAPASARHLHGEIQALEGRAGRAGTSRR